MSEHSTVKLMVVQLSNLLEGLEHLVLGRDASELVHEEEQHAVLATGRDGGQLVAYHVHAHRDGGVQRLSSQRQSPRRMTLSSRRFVRVFHGRVVNLTRTTEGLTLRLRYSKEP